MIDQICKEIVTLYKYTMEVQHDRYKRPYYRVTDKRKDLVYRVVRKFLDHMKDSKYAGSEDSFGTTYYKSIKTHLTREKKDEDNSIWLTWVQFQLHRFIHDNCPEYDPNDKLGKKPRFYKGTLEMLLR